MRIGARMTIFHVWFTHTWSYEHVKRDDFAREGADDKYTARAVPRVVATAIRHLHARAGISLLGDEKRWERFTVRSLAPVKYVYVARRPPPEFSFFKKPSETGKKFLLSIQERA